MATVKIVAPKQGKELAAVPITHVQQMISSCSGAIVTSLLMTPFDVVKIRLQAQQTQFPMGSCFIYSNGLMDHICVCNYCKSNGSESAAAATNTKPTHSHQNRYRATPQIEYNKQWYGRPGKFTGSFDAFLKIAKTEGPTSLWSGLPPTLVMSIPVTVFYFTLYDKIKYAMGYREDKPETKHIPILAGIIARTGSATIISPLELIRTKMQSELLTYKEVGVAVKDAIKKLGLLALWRGTGPTLLRDVPFSGIYWFLYELFKSQQTGGVRDPTFFQTFISGAGAGSVAAVLTLPFDVVKTRRQIEIGTAVINGDAKRTSTMMTIKRIYGEEGARALFTGLAPRLLKVAPACAIMISSYEYFKHLFRVRNSIKMGDTE